MQSLSLFLCLFLSTSFFLSLSLSICLFLSVSFSLSLSLCLLLSVSLSVSCLSISLCISQFFFLSLSLNLKMPFFLSVSLSLSLSAFLSHTLFPLSLSLSVTYSLWHSFFFSLSLSLSLSFSLSIIVMAMHWTGLRDRSDDQNCFLKLAKICLRGPSRTNGGQDSIVFFQHVAMIPLLWAVQGHARCNSLSLLFSLSIYIYISLSISPSLSITARQSPGRSGQVLTPFGKNMAMDYKMRNASPVPPQNSETTRPRKWLGTRLLWRALGRKFSELLAWVLEWVQQEASITWCDLFRPKLAEKRPQLSHRMKSHQNWKKSNSFSSLNMHMWSQAKSDQNWKKSNSFSTLNMPSSFHTCPFHSPIGWSHCLQPPVFDSRSGLGLSEGNFRRRGPSGRADLLLRHPDLKQIHLASRDVTLPPVVQMALQTEKTYFRINYASYSRYRYRLKLFWN